MWKIGAIIILLVDVLIYFLPSPIQNPEAFYLGPLPSLPSVLVDLAADPSRVELLFNGKLKGPESIEFDSAGRIYLSLGNGSIVRSVDPVSGQNEIFLEEFVHIGQRLPDCGLDELEDVCGRPLGLRFDKSGNLLAMDGSSGLLNISSTGKIQQLVSQYKGEPFKFPNDLVIMDDGTIYFSDSSTRFKRRDNSYDVFEGRASGRLFHYIPSTKTTEMVLDELYFPNGVEVHPSKDFLVVSETTRARIFKYYLRGPKTGSKEIFVENLPCLPDNIRWDSKAQVFWVGCATKRVQPFSLIDSFSAFPSLRSLLTKMLPKSLLYKLVPTYGMLLGLDAEGNIVKGYKDASGVVAWVSEAHHHGGYAYFGSFRQTVLPRYMLDE